jgi:hypothetical protein
MLRDTKFAHADDSPRPAEDEVALSLHADWTKEEEVRAKRKLVPNVSLEPAAHVKRGPD